MAHTRSTAYALVDKDVTQDADLLIPGKKSPSSSNPTTQYAAQGADLSNPVDNRTVPPSKPDTADKEEEQKSPLLRLPTEVKQNIWTMLVTCDNPITPHQLVWKSNKFLWNAAQVADGYGFEHNVSAVGPLMVVALTHTCKEMYTDISLTHLFYRNNQFDFSKYPDHMNTYLVAITDERRRAITSMHFHWDITRDWKNTEDCQSMALIASCKSLRSLKMSVALRYPATLNGSDYFSQRAEYGLTFAALQGLKELDIVAECNPHIGGHSFEKLEAACKVFKDNMAGTMATERTGNYDLKLFRQAQEKARLDIDGEGRLLDDRKPGIVSSRTRSQVAKAKTLTPDGILPTGEFAKYDGDGMLAWFVKTVLDCREVSSDDGSAGIEFLLECEPHHGCGSSKAFNGRTETSWEDASVVSFVYECHVAQFYQNNPDKPGISAVYDEWVGQGELFLETKKFATRHAKSYRPSYLRNLEAVMKQNDKDKKAKEAEEAKEAKARAKAEKVAKAKANKAAANKAARSARGKKA